jgi:hypothetical protein
MIRAPHFPNWCTSARAAAGAACVLGAALATTQTFAAKPDTPAGPPPPQTAAKPATMTMADFLDQLMAAESSGRDDARNPRSTAVGPYQFIESTWLDLAHRIFATETQGMNMAQVLALRTNRAFARRAAEAYTKDNAASLKAAGLEATFPHLRLAFLLGPQGAIRVLQASPETRVALLLGPSVTRANPFMYGMTAAGLAARAAKDLAREVNRDGSVSRTALAGIAASDGTAVASAAAKPRPPRVVVRCNLDLPACRRWQTLALARLPGEKSATRQQQTVAKAR